MCSRTRMLSTNAAATAASAFDADSSEGVGVDDAAVVFAVRAGNAGLVDIAAVVAVGRDDVGANEGGEDSTLGRPSSPRECCASARALAAHWCQH
mmetsp:Transcript_7751/g.25744  ORF Transcript_7751/g.25744 Transcript_7751/m.25744 type:complete len:95 (-) Transcript_7751:1124-1408(-)